MHLYLSTTSPWNATYSNAEGQVIYKAEIPRTLFSLRPPITIKRAAASPDQFSLLAEIDFRSATFLTPNIRYNGIDLDTSEFFRKTGNFRRNRAFRGPDGKEYEWHLGSVCKLYLKDPSNTLVAHYHRRKLGFIGAPRPASLEIFSQGQHMLDFIVVTFIFVEKLHDNSQRSRKNNASHWQSLAASSSANVAGQAAAQAQFATAPCGM